MLHCFFDNPLLAEEPTRLHFYFLLLNMVNPFSPTDFLRGLLAVSTAFVARERSWLEEMLVDRVHDYVDEAAYEQLQQPFDFIVVGSGYSGSSLAKHLTSGGCFRVLLLEIGTIPEFTTAIPFLRSESIEKVAATHMTVPQRHAAKGLKNDQVKMYLSRSIGGRSAMDLGIFAPVNPNDFFRLAFVHNLTSWTSRFMREHMVEAVETDELQNDDYDVPSSNTNSTVELLADLRLLGNYSATNYSSGFINGSQQFSGNQFNQSSSSKLLQNSTELRNSLLELANRTVWTSISQTLAKLAEQNQDPLRNRVPAQNPNPDPDPGFKKGKSDRTRRDSLIFLESLAKKHRRRRHIGDAASDSEKSSGENVFSKAWNNGWEQLNLTVSRGIKADIYHQSVAFTPLAMVDKGTLMNAAGHFLRAAPPDMLTILANVEPLQVIFDAAHSRPVGIQFMDLNGNVHRAAVKKEVILTAGAVPTAKLLIQSGIGPVDHLDELGIPAVRNLPVGSQLYDRVSANIYLLADAVHLETIKEDFADMEEFLGYMENGTGIHANPLVFGSLLYKTDPRLKEADLLLELKPVSLLGTEDFAEVMNYDNETTNSIDPDGGLARSGGLHITLTVLRPYSQGVFWLQKFDNSSRFHSATNPGYLQDVRDAQALVRGIMAVEALLATDSMRQLGVKMIRPLLRRCPKYEDGPRKYWLCVVRHVATTGNFAVGTAPIGSVVDEEMRVQSVEGLRIVDESIFSQPISGGVAATLMTLANRAAASIRSTYQSELKPECGISPVSVVLV